MINNKLETRDHQRWKIDSNLQYLRLIVITLRWKKYRGIDISRKTIDHFFRSSRTKAFLGKGALKICSKFTGEHTCRSVISIKVAKQSNFIEIALRHGCSPVNLLHIFRTSFPKNVSGWLVLFLVNYLLLRNHCQISLLKPSRFNSFMTEAVII